jgi:hypothetical protein
MPKPADLPQLFQQFDVTGQGESLAFGEFYKLFSHVRNRARADPVPREIAHFYFLGAARDNPSQITIQEAGHLFDCIDTSPDSVEFATLIFCALDINRVHTIGAQEISSRIALFPPDTKIGAIIARAEKEVEGTTLRLNHARFLEISTGTVIQSNCDPYGNVTKSVCCLLL